MNTGRMTAVVTLTASTKAVDSYGSAVKTLGTPYECRAMARPLSSYERMTYGLPVTSVAYRFSFWYNDASTVKAGDTLTYSGQSFTVNTVEDFMDKTTEIHLIATRS